MGNTNMMTLSVHLDPQPGQIIPELHLKQGTTSLQMRLLIAPKGILTDYLYKVCIITAKLPNGQEFFRRSSCAPENRRICIYLYTDDLRILTEKAGTYRCTITILDTHQYVNKSEMMDYETLTVLPFQVIVHERAKGDG